MHSNAFAAAFYNEAAWHLSTQSDPTAHRHHQASTTVACDVAERDFHRLPSCCGSRPSAFTRYNKSPSLRSSFSRAQPSAPQHDISNNLTLQHLRPIPCILPEDDSFHFQYMFFFFSLSKKQLHRLICEWGNKSGMVISCSRCPRFVVLLGNKCS